MSKVLVRATVHLPGLKLGQEAIVDSEDPYIASCLEAQLIVRIDFATNAGVSELPAAAGAAGSAEGLRGEAVPLDGEGAVVEHLGPSDSGDESVSDS